MILIFISSGLFLGWSLGANDAANVFGSAVGSKMLKFRTAAIVASIFVVLGSVFQGQGASNTLNTLGRVDAIAGAFTVALSAALTIFTISRYKLPVSTSQAIVGAIIGWNMYTGHRTDLNSVIQIASSWIASPLLGALLSMLLYFCMKKIILKSKIHLILLDSYLRISLIILAALGAYSLGANNIANVMGVFSNCNLQANTLDFGLFKLNNTQQLFLIGGLSIATGILTRSKQMVEAVGSNLFKLSSEAALVVVLAETLVLFVFSSHSLSLFCIRIGLPPIPLVPVSSTQVMIGCILGVAIFKGGKGIKFQYLGQIAIGWIVCPLISGVISFIALFFINNVFVQEVKSNGQSITHYMTSAPVHPNLQKATPAYQIPNVTQGQIVKTIDISRPFLLIVSTLIILLLIYIIFEKQKFKIKRRNEIRRKLEQVHLSNRAVMQAELRTSQIEKQRMRKEKEFKRKYILNFGFDLLQNLAFIDNIRKSLEAIKQKDYADHEQIIERLLATFENNTFLETNRKEFLSKLDDLNSSFYNKLDEEAVNLTEGEKRLLSLIMLRLNNRDIAKILKKSPASIKIFQMRLRRKLKIPSEIEIGEYLSLMFGK